MSARTPEQMARQLGVPVIPPKVQPVAPDANPVLAVCGGCGIEMRRVMCLFCLRNDCPFSAKVVF